MYISKCTNGIVEEDNMEQIKKALYRLGYRGTASVYEYALGLYKVTVNGEYLGIYDVNRKTFVD